MRDLPPLGCALLTVAANCAAEVPLRPDATRHPVVPTTVNGTAPVDFIFDTGADETSVFSWLARKLRLPSAGEGEVDGATGKASAALSRIDSLSVDGHALDNVTALTLPDRPDGPALGGIVAADLMAGRLAVLDFGCARGAAAAERTR
jgi:predicted aspartyl protease